MLCKKCGMKMVFTAFGLFLCSECEFKSTEEGDPQELNFDRLDYSKFKDEETDLCD